MCESENFISNYVVLILWVKIHIVWPQLVHFLPEVDVFRLKVGDEEQRVDILSNLHVCTEPSLTRSCLYFMIDVFFLLTLFFEPRIVIIK